jgi:hypothetical protein
MPRPLFTPRKDPVPIVQETGWAPELKSFGRSRQRWDNIKTDLNEIERHRMEGCRIKARVE